jgi:hypothetical protein
MITAIAGLFAVATAAQTLLATSSTTTDPAEPSTGQADHGRRLPPIRSEGLLDNGRHQCDADWHLRNAIEPAGSTGTAKQNEHLYPHAGTGRQFEDAHRPDRRDHWHRSAERDGDDDH